MKIIIINGPNSIQNKNMSADIEYFQSNVEGEIINKLHETGFEYDGIILNAGGYTHTSVAIGDAVRAIETPVIIGDAVRAIETPVIEVHISNIFSREKYRHESFIAPAARGTISGFGIHRERNIDMNLL